MGNAGHGIALGMGQNDSIVRIYSSDCNNDRIFESTWTGSNWNTIQIIDWCSTDLEVAPGRGDGVYRLYCSGQGASLREYSWNGVTWTYVDLDSSSSSYYDVSVGTGRNNGVTRVYSGNSLSPRSLYEFTWTGSAWDKARVGGMPSLPRCVIVGAGRNDGISRVYSGTTGGSRYALEYSWNGAGWDSSWVDSTGISSSYQDGLICNGRNDIVQRLYMGSSDGFVYEFTYTSTGVEEIPLDSPLIKGAGGFKAKPNPFHSNTTLHFVLPTSGFISLNIYDIEGRLVRTLANQNLERGSYQFLWEGTDDHGKTLPCGIYFSRLVTNTFTTTKGIIRLR